MNLDLFDDMEGIILHEREASLVSEMKNNNGNGSMTRFPKNTPLAMAYVPFQQWGETYGDDEALSRGTLFPELDLPFLKGGADK
jgi:alkylhydroperoxidase/carboxymuconolactone decarboxylase family protein YurZ